jgi:hypothetical protein
VKAGSVGRDQTRASTQSRAEVSEKMIANDLIFFEGANTKAPFCDERRSTPKKSFFCHHSLRAILQKKVGPPELQIFTNAQKYMSGN